MGDPQTRGGAQSPRPNSQMGGKAERRGHGPRRHSLVRERARGENHCEAAHTLVRGKGPKRRSLHLCRKAMGAKAGVVHRADAGKLFHLKLDVSQLLLVLLADELH